MAGRFSSYLSSFASPSERSSDDRLLDAERSHNKLLKRLQRDARLRDVVLTAAADVEAGSWA